MQLILQVNPLKVEVNGLVTVQFESESVTGSHPATVKIFAGMKEVGVVEAHVRQQPGADGGQYSVVIFQQKK